MNRGKALLVILLIMMVGYTVAQMSTDNQLSAGQTNYKISIEKELIVNELTLSDCTPVLVNEMGSYVFSRDNPNCPTGVFEINEGELLLKTVSMENSIDDLNETINSLIDRVVELEKGGLSS